MSAPSLIASLAHAGNPTTAPTITFGTTQAGDILFAFFTNGGADADPTLSGTTITTGGLTWTKKTSVGGGALTDLNGSLWWARATGNHTGQTVIGATTNSGSAVGGVIRGAPSAGDPFDNAITALNASGVNAITGYTPAADECLVLLLLGTDDNIASDTYTSTGTPATLLEQQDALSTGGVDTAASLATGSQTSAASLGIISWNNARGAGIYQAVILATVKPLPTIAMQTISAAPTVPSPAVAPGAVSIVIGALAPAASVPQHQVSQLVQVGALAAGATVHDPTVVPDVAGVTSPLEVSLTNPATTPDVDTLHTVVIRAEISAGTGELDVELRQGANVLDSWTLAIAPGWTEFSRTLSEAVVASITDYSDLRLRWTGSGTAGDEVRVSQAKLRFPEGTSGGTQTIVLPLLAATTMVSNPQIVQQVAVDALSAQASVKLPQAAQIVAPAALSAGTTVQSPDLTQVVAVGALDASVVVRQPGVGAVGGTGRTQLRQAGAFAHKPTKRRDAGAFTEKRFKVKTAGAFQDAV